MTDDDRTLLAELRERLKERPVTAGPFTLYRLLTLIEGQAKVIAELEPINKAVNDWVDSRLAIVGKELSPGFADELLMNAVLGEPKGGTK